LRPWKRPRKKLLQSISSVYDGCMPKLFSALELPGTARLRLAALKAPFETARWVAPDDLHITLRFAGEISRRQGEEFAHALSDIQLPPPRIQISGTGVFGGKHPTVVYAAVERTPELEELQRAHEHAARTVGLERESRKFVPHVTLARLDGEDAIIVANFLELTGALKIPAFWPQRAVLMSARDGGGGPYGVVDSFPFLGTYDGEDET
jgi:RNA 2',3'-cyclic 3'-phosphodiesterase